MRRARVASVHAVRVDVWTDAGPVQASLRSRFLCIEGGIAVGDEVHLGETEDVVEEILPRKTVSCVLRALSWRVAVASFGATPIGW